MYKSLIIVNTIVALFMCTIQTTAQTIRLDNPSFEDEPASNTTPKGWFDCGKPGETPPDTQPHSTFKVSKKAQQGNTYLGMVARDTDTWEAVAQLLEMPLSADECYDFSIHLARSESYLSHRKTDAVQIQFTQPIRLRIWGGNNYCDKSELLAETDIIEHTNWKKYKFKLKPLRECNFIMLEAFYMTPTLVAYNGNILMDNCSSITLAVCKDDEPLIAIIDAVQHDRYAPPKPNKKEKNDRSEQPKKITKKEITKTKPTPTKVKGDNPVVITPPTTTKPPASVKIEEPKVEKPPSTNILPELKDKDFIKEGRIIQVNSLQFPADSSTVLTESSYFVLEEVYYFLKQNKGVIIEIGGHTNDRPLEEYSYKLSTDRAETVARYLIEKGISESRISAKGYGKTQPITSNKTWAGRNRNQRVEIKITSTGK